MCPSLNFCSISLKFIKNLRILWSGLHRCLEFGQLYVIRSIHFMWSQSVNLMADFNGDHDIKFLWNDHRLFPFRFLCKLDILIRFPFIDFIYNLLHLFNIYYYLLSIKSISKCCNVLIRDIDQHSNNKFNVIQYRNYALIKRWHVESK